MNPFSFIWSAYLRWRHSRGFGVHSPFAFGLVNSAVRPGRYGYYGYSVIDDFLLLTEDEAYPRIKKDAYLLLRLLVTLTPKHLYLSPDAPIVFHATAKAAGVPILILSPLLPPPEKDDFIFMRGDSYDWATVVKFLKRGVTVLAADVSAGLKGCIENAVERGTVFSGTRITLAVPREDMALVKYSMKF